MADTTAIVNVPNMLTLGRLLLGFVVCALIGAGMYAGAFWIFLVAALTDALDGYVARALGQTSVLGRQLDPLVDKILVIVVMIHLTPVAGSSLLAWVATIVATREFVVQALRSLVEGRGVAFGARWSGKLKTAVQCFAVATILTRLAYPAVPHVGLIESLALWTAAVLTAYSGVEYLLAAARILIAAPSSQREDRV
jgi:CDP-diacylglycerol--glycerol-3-phosphate 3-phosphatidyltransferase